MNSANLEFIPMNSSHLDQLLEIESLCFGDGWSRLTLKAILTDKNSHFIIAALDGDIIGYGGIRTVLDEGSLDNIAILPSFQGQGYGQLLLLYLIGHARKLKVDTLMLEVRESNQSAIKLYSKLGFYTVGKREGYYTKPSESALLMNLEVNNEDK